MIGFKEYFLNSIEQDTIDEGLIKNLISLNQLNTLNPEEFLDGVLDMYDVIAEGENIKLFFDEIEIGQRTLWKNLYKLYQNKAWGIIDITNADEKENLANELGIPENSVTQISVKLRRQLRNLIRQSSNKNLDLNATQVDEVILISDPTFKDKSYLVTFNKPSGILNKMIKGGEIKFLKKAFEKVGEVAKQHSK